MHDQVANLQVPEIREEGPGRRLPALVDPPFLLEEIRFGKDQQRSLRQVEAARQLPGRDEHGGARQSSAVPTGARPDFIVGEKFDRAFGTAGLAATNTTASPRSRAARISSTQSPMRPWYSSADTVDTCTAPALPPSISSWLI